jgi:hypothetical protein
LTPITGPQQAAFEAASQRWREIINADYASQVCVPAGYTACGYTFPTETCIDDLMIAVKISSIDGVGGILGQAGPCLYTGSQQTPQSRFGVMQFDVSDVDNMINRGTFNNVILHEMGHVLGLGVFWDWRGLLGSGSPLLYQGAEGNIGNAEIGGPSEGAYIEEGGGGGTARSHFSEFVYDGELMTGWAENGPMPLSRLTARALRDLGYSTNVDAADSFQTPNGRRLLREHRVRDSLKNDVLAFPLTRVTDERPKRKHK